MDKLCILLVPTTHVCHNAQFKKRKFILVFSMCPPPPPPPLQLRSRIRIIHPDPARKLSANLYDIYHCCVYSEKLLMMDRGTVRNMQSFIPK
jgi:hypothetical protein